MLMCWLSLDGELFVDDQEYYYEQDQQETFDQGKYSLGHPWLPIPDTHKSSYACVFVTFLRIS
jgi:hypothetical protein